MGNRHHVLVHVTLVIDDLLPKGADVDGHNVVVLLLLLGALHGRVGVGLLPAPEANRSPSLVSLALGLLIYTLTRQLKAGAFRAGLRPLPRQPKLGKALGWKDAGDTNGKTDISQAPRTREQL
eukprot:2942542-Pyramimonas_sp.AAC.3